LGAFQSPLDIPLQSTEIEQNMSYVIGAAMLVRREFIEQIGLMNEDYFLYFEEIDWATRGASQYKLGYAPKSVVYHKEGASIGTSASGGSALSVYYLYRNRLLFTWRFHRCFILTVFIVSLIDIAKLLYRQHWHQSLAALRGIFGLSFQPSKK
jgi:GT2 family glycosyltransferase